MRQFGVPVAMMGALLLSACANFWTIPGEPLTTAELCARAEDVNVRSAPGGVGHRSIADKSRLTVEALRNQAASGEYRFAAALYAQANSLILHPPERSDFSAGERYSSGRNYWKDRCREARERDERARG